MEDIYYLVHNTSRDLKKSKALKANPFPICKKAANKDQFPGVYMTLVTSHNIDKVSFFPGSTSLIFSKDLLKQQNYHINIRDANGMINEHITYFPWQLNELVEKLKEQGKGSSNEVVFHNDVPMKYCCAKIKLDSVLPVNMSIPRGPMTNKAKPNMTLLPFYCYVNEDTYTGDPLPPPSSLEWFKMLAKVARINSEFKTKQEYIDAIRAKSIYICNNRYIQNITAIQTYVKPTGNIFSRFFSYIFK